MPGEQSKIVCDACGSISPAGRTASGRASCKQEAGLERRPPEVLARRIERQLLMLTLYPADFFVKTSVPAPINVMVARIASKAIFIRHSFRSPRARQAAGLATRPILDVDNSSTFFAGPNQYRNAGEVALPRRTPLPSAATGDAIFFPDASLLPGLLQSFGGGGIGSIGTCRG
jgi:hypothetical protein